MRTVYIKPQAKLSPLLPTDCTQDSTDTQARGSTQDSREDDAWRQGNFIPSRIHYIPLPFPLCSPKEKYLLTKFISSVRGAAGSLPLGKERSEQDFCANMNRIPTSLAREQPHLLSQAVKYWRKGMQQLRLCGTKINWGHKSPIQLSIYFFHSTLYVSVGCNADTCRESSPTHLWQWYYLLLFVFLVKASIFYQPCNRQMWGVLQNCIPLPDILNYTFRDL